PLAGLQVRDIQGAVLEQGGIGAALRLVVLALTNELVAAGVLLVVAHADNDASVRGKSHGRSFVIEAAERRMLLMERLVERIDLDDPAVMRQRQLGRL